MAAKGTSRWADTEQDAELEARRNSDREKKRLKRAQRARQLEDQQRQDTRPAVFDAAAGPGDGAEPDKHGGGGGGDDNGARPSKRRKLTPLADADDAPRLPRLEAGSWTKSRSVDNYDKLNDIEEGTYGWVARGSDKATGDVVALKRLKLEPQDRSGLPVTGLREIQILRNCSHPNVVAMKEVVVGRDLSKLDNSIFLVLEFVEHDLKGILDDMPEPFLASEIKRLLLQLTQGVAYLHDNWILHRDLKTSNLLLNNRGQLKIADFGMARYVGDPPPPRLTQLVVTLWYRAPELLLGTRSYGAAVDMWSVGCVFGELMTREPLLQGSNEVDQMSKIFELCGVPTEESWPTFRRLPNAGSLKLPKTPLTTGSVIRARFPNLTTAGAGLLNSLLALDPDRRPTAARMLQHEYFRQDPKPKPESLFPTFPSKAGQERRKRHEPHAPIRGRAAALGEVDLSGIFQGREREERGAGFTLRLV